MLNPRRSVTATPAGRLLVVLALAAVVGAGLAACGDEATDARKARAAKDAPAPHHVKWLDLGSQITPAQWLVSRREATLKPADDPEVQHVARQLAAAHAVYRESERMIANRAAQLSDMLAPLGIDERATTILDDLLGIAGETGQTEGFGAVSQYYFNLRASNIARDEALATLKNRYGRKKS